MSETGKAKEGLNLLKEAVLDYIRLHPEGVTNVEIARDLDLESDFEGDQKNYLSWSVLGILVNVGLVRYGKRPKGRVYFLG